MLSTLQCLEENNLKNITKIWKIGQNGKFSENIQKIMKNLQ